MTQIIGIVANLDKPNALVEAKKIAAFLRKRSASVSFEDDLAGALGQREASFSLANAGTGVDAMVVLGGDGTLIRTFRKLGRKETPLLGIHLGGLGFLTEVRLDEAERTLGDLLDGKLIVRERSTLDGYCLRDGEKMEEFTALNDAVIGKGGLARVIHMEAFIDDEYLTAYMADGIILATPTGSTAYSLSAQGPIISPETDAILLTPICPHTLTNRPIIIGGERTIRITMISTPPGTGLTIDGQSGYPLQAGDDVIVRKGRQTLHLLTDPGASYYGILRKKLSWGGRSHYQPAGGNK